MADTAIHAPLSNPMDRHYRYQRFVYDKTRRYFLIGRGHLIDQLNPLPGQTVLEMGCGTAWNLIQVSHRYSEAKVFGVDLSRTMLETASKALERNGLQEHIVIGQGDATSFDPKTTLGRDQFDHIFFSYTLSMIPDWPQALQHATAMLAPGGTVHIVDFGQCDGLPKSFKRTLFRFLAHYKVTPRGALASHLAEQTTQDGFKINAVDLHRGYTCYLAATAP